MTSVPSRREVLKAGVAAAGVTALSLTSARADDAPIRIGYWPIAAGLPFYAAVEKGFFKDAGLAVEAVKFASANQVVEALIAGRIDGAANGTATATQVLGNFTAPGYVKIFCSNPSNRTLVLDEFVVAKDSPYKTIADLAGKTVACGPGIQNIVLAKTVLARNGIAEPTVTELPIGQHVAALAAGQIDACYTLEPTGTLGAMKGLTRVLEHGVISRYVLGDPDAPWYGGSASLATAFLDARPEAAKAYMDAYARGVALVADDPTEARRFLVGYTSIEADLAAAVPLAGYVFAKDFTEKDFGYFQTFFDLFTNAGIFPSKVDVPSLMLTS